MVPSKPAAALQHRGDIQPLVSIVMPVRNEGSFIFRTLRAVLNQEYSPDRFEVVVVDGMSSDGTREIVLELMKTHPALVFVQNPSGIVPTAMNIGIKVSRGEVIVRVDGHTVIEPDYVRQCVDALQRTGADNVGGRMDAVGSGSFGRAVAAATSAPFGVGGSRFHYAASEEWAETVYMGAWPRSVFERIGLFDEEMVRNQDDEFNYRIGEQGGKILLSPVIRSTYYSRSTIRSLWRQYFQYGFWKVRVMQKHPRQMRLRHYVPATFVSSLGLSAVAAAIWPGSVFLFLTILCSYSVGLAAATLGSCGGLDRKTAAALPLVFATLHVSYGSGFVLGLFRFWNRWKRSAERSP